MLSTVKHLYVKHDTMFILSSPASVQCDKMFSRTSLGAFHGHYFNINYYYDNYYYYLDLNFLNLFLGVGS